MPENTSLNIISDTKICTNVTKVAKIILYIFCSINCLQENNIWLVGSALFLVVQLLCLSTLALMSSGKCI